LLASENSMQSTNNIKMTRLQMRFQVMIAMNVLSIMHGIVVDIKTRGFAMKGYVLKIRYYINILL
jgi:hypothetical protein